MPAKLLHMRMPIDADADAVLLLSPDVAVVPATSPFPCRPAGAEALQPSAGVQRHAATRRATVHTRHRARVAVSHPPPAWPRAGLSVPATGRPGRRPSGCNSSQTRHARIAAVGVTASGPPRKREPAAASVSCNPAARVCRGGKFSNRVFPFPEILNLFLYSILSRRVCFLCGAGEAVAARPGRGEWPPGSTSTTARRRPAAPHAEGRCAPPRTALGHRRFSVRGRRIKSVAVVAAARRDTTARGRGRGEVKFTHLPLDRRCRSVSERDRRTD
jgi:hypothetical protein